MLLGVSIGESKQYPTSGTAFFHTDNNARMDSILKHFERQRAKLEVRWQFRNQDRVQAYLDTDGSLNQATGLEKFQRQEKTRSTRIICDVTATGADGRAQDFKRGLYLLFHTKG